MQAMKAGPRKGRMRPSPRRLLRPARMRLPDTAVCVAAAAVAAAVTGARVTSDSRSRMLPMPPFSLPLPLWGGGQGGRKIDRDCVRHRLAERVLVLADPDMQ